MAESSNLRLKAREIMVTPSLEGIETLVEQLYMPRETDEFQTALALFYFCAADFSNLLTLKLLKVYQSSSNNVLRFHSISLLSELVAEFRARGFEFSLVALYELKPLLISCLMMQETKQSDIKILRRILSFVAYNVMTLDHDGWDELSDCIFSLADKEPLKAFHVFLDLPRVYGRFIYRFMLRVLDKATNVLFNLEESRLEDWTLGLETVVKIGIQLLDTEMMRYDLIKKLLHVIVMSASELTKKGMEQFLLRGLEGLEAFLSRDKDLYCYSKVQCHFVSAVAYKIEGVATHTKEVARRINRLVRSSYNNPASKPLSSVLQPQDHGAEFDHLKGLSAMEVLKIFASTDLEERSRELAIRRLNVLLSNHTLKKVKIEVSMMRQLQPLLIYCLWSKGISDSMFKVLGEVVNHVAYEMFYIQKNTWLGLRDYIASKSKTEFERAVYIFQSLTMPLEDNEFVVFVTENLFPEIRSRLNPPRELLVDNSCWVFAFTGAFCAIIHSTEILSLNELVKEISYKMVDSVKELVDRKMEVGLVRRAFRDVETIVKKQLEWYGTSEYKFLKGLLWKLYAIKEMKWESKIVLWRINVIVERGVTVTEKENPKGELEWINQSED